jgi:hypothetical protein
MYHATPKGVMEAFGLLGLIVDQLKYPLKAYPASYHCGLKAAIVSVL